MNVQNLIEEIEGYYPDIPSNLLPLYVKTAMNYFMAITNLNDVPQTANTIIIRLVVIYFNKLGYEGLSSSSQGGNALNWGTDLPQDLQNEINQYLKIRWV